MLDPNVLETQFLALLDSVLPIPVGWPAYTPPANFYGQCASAAGDIHDYNYCMDIMLDPYRLGHAQFPFNNGSARWYAVEGGPGHGWIWEIIPSVINGTEPRMAINQNYEQAIPPGSKATSNQQVIANLNDLEHGPFLPTGFFAWQSKFRYVLDPIPPSTDPRYKEAPDGTTPYTDPATGKTYLPTLNPNWTLNRQNTTKAATIAITDPTNVGLDGNVALLAVLYSKTDMKPYLGLTPGQAVNKIDPAEFPNPLP